MPNQKLPGLKNKKIILMGGIVLVAVILLVVLFSAKGCQKKKITQTPQVIKEKTVEVKKNEAAPEPSGSAQLFQETTKPVVQGETLANQEKPTQIAISASTPVKKSFKWIRKKRIKDVPTLIGMLKKALDKGDEKTLNLSLKSLAAENEDVTGLLKDEIMNNFSRPDIRRNAIWGLFYVDSPDAVPILKTLIKVDPDESVRAVALFVLYSMSLDSAGFIEEISRTDASEKIRLKAQEYYRLKSINQ